MSEVLPAMSSQKKVASMLTLEIPVPLRGTSRAISQGLASHQPNMAIGREPRSISETKTK